MLCGETLVYYVIYFWKDVLRILVLLLHNSHDCKPLYNCGKLLDQSTVMLFVFKTTDFTEKSFGCVATWISYIVYMSL